MAQTYYVNQNNSGLFTFDLMDESGVTLNLSSIATLVMTQYYYNPELKSSDIYHLTTINSRSNQSVKNTNNVAVSSTGRVSWTIQPADMAKVNINTDIELHITLWTWYWSGKRNNLEVYWWVRKIPFAV